MTVWLLGYVTVKTRPKENRLAQVRTKRKIGDTDLPFVEPTLSLGMFLFMEARTGQRGHRCLTKQVGPLLSLAPDPYIGSMLLIYNKPNRSSKTHRFPLHSLALAAALGPGYHILQICAIRHNYAVLVLFFFFFLARLRLEWRVLLVKRGHRNVRLPLYLKGRTRWNTVAPQKHAHPVGFLQSNTINKQDISIRFRDKMSIPSSMRNLEVMSCRLLLHVAFWTYRRTFVN